MLAAVIQCIPMISPRTSDMIVFSKNGFEIYCEKSDEKIVDQIVDRLNSNRTRIYTVLQRESYISVKIYLYKNIRTFHIKHYGLIIGPFLPDWIIGDNSIDSVFITSPLSPGPQHSYETIMQACVHEYVHVITDNMYSRTDKWLKEGIAVYLADQKPDEKDIRGSRVDYSNFTNVNGIKFGSINGYALSYTLIDFLTKKYGFDKIIALIISKNDYMKTFGKSKKAIYDEWNDYLSEL